MSEKESIIEKVRKLLRLAERAGTPEESQTAFARASELLYKYKIERSELGSLDEKREIAKAVSEQGFACNWYPWADDLIPTIAENFACEYFTKHCRGDRKEYAGFIGLKEDAEIAKVVFDNAFAYVKLKTAGMTRQYKYFYGKGFVTGLNEKFQEMRRAKEQFAIVMKPPKEATDYITRTCKTVIIKSKSYEVDWASAAAYERGKEAGKAFNPHSTIAGQCVTGALKG